MLADATKLLQPRNHKASVVIWSDISVPDMDLIVDATSADQIRQELVRIFNLGDHKENEKNAILLDLYYYTIQFARDNKFTKEQTSAVFSMVKKTHEVCVETPFGNVMQCYNYFKELVLCHAVKRPPFSIDLFSTEEVRLITDHVVNTYFRHYKMYKYVFTPRVRLDLSISYEGMPATSPSSEAGDQQEAEGEEVPVDEEKGDEKPPEPEPEQTETKKQEESPAASELRALVREHVSKEIKLLKTQVEEQIKETATVLNQKLTDLESTQNTNANKGGKSPKGKKK